MSEARITELETKLIFAEDLIETLNQTVIRQQAQLDQIQQQLRLLHRQLQDALAREAPAPGDQPPPHY